MNKKSITKYSKTVFILANIISVICYAAAAILNGVEGIESIAGFANAAIIYIVMLFVFKSKIGFEQNIFKSIPIYIMPIGLNSLVKNVSAYLLDIATPYIDSEIGNTVIANAISAAAASVISLVICLAFFIKPIDKYARLFEEKSSIVFTPEYRLSAKWWFLLVGSLVGGFFSAIITMGGRYTSGMLGSITSAVGLIINYVIIYAFFNSSLKQIDKQTRKLFLPNILLTTISPIFLHLIEVLTLFIPIKTLNGVVNEMAAQGITNIYSMFASVLVTFIISLIGLILEYWLCKKNFESYEQKSELK